MGGAVPDPLHSARPHMLLDEESRVYAPLWTIRPPMASDQGIPRTMDAWTALRMGRPSAPLPVHADQGARPLPRLRRIGPHDPKQKPTTSIPLHGSAKPNTATARLSVKRPLRLSAPNQFRRPNAIKTSIHLRPPPQSNIGAARAQ